MVKAIRVFIVGSLEGLVKTEGQDELIHCVSERMDCFGKQTRRSRVKPADQLDQKVGAVS